MAACDKREAIEPGTFRRESSGREDRLKPMVPCARPPVMLRQSRPHHKDRKPSDCERGRFAVAVIRVLRFPRDADLSADGIPMRQR